VGSRKKGIHNPSPALMKMRQTPARMALDWAGLGSFARLRGRNRE
jgi:hypothetical protein